MAFEVEVLTAEDRFRYNTDPEMMDLSKVPLKSWIIDKERDISIWGGLHNNHWMAMAEGDDRWQFQLRYKQKIFKVIVWPREGSSGSYSDNPYIIAWESIESIFPRSLHGLDIEDIKDVFKDSLTAFCSIKKMNVVKGKILVNFEF